MGFLIQGGLILELKKTEGDLKREKRGAKRKEPDGRGGRNFFTAGSARNNVWFNLIISLSTLFVCLSDDQFFLYHVCLSVHIWTYDYFIKFQIVYRSVYVKIHIFIYLYLLV